MIHLRAWSVVLLIAGFLSACSLGRLGEQVHKMGEVVTVGPVVYNVYETRWSHLLGSAVESVAAEERYLLISLTITNSGNRQLAIPLLSLEDSSGAQHLEAREVKGVADWLGLLRIMEPASTIQGTIVFDVSSADYHLRVTDGGDLERERTALIEIPLTLSTPGSVEPRQTGTGL